MSLRIWGWDWRKRWCSFLVEAVRSYGPMCSHSASKALKTLILQIFAKNGCNIQEANTKNLLLGLQVEGAGAVCVTVRHLVLPVGRCLGTGGKVDIGCWCPDRTLRDALMVWCGGFSGPQTVVSADHGSLTSAACAGCLVGEWDVLQGPQTWIYIRLCFSPLMWL